MDKGGIGITFPAVAAAHPGTHLLSIAVHGATAMCGDVENGALSNWEGYGWGYCAVSNVNDMIRRFGRPKKLWTAHYDPKFGSHICSPHCWPGLVTTADGTQWTNHGKVGTSPCWPTTSSRSHRFRHHDQRRRQRGLDSV